MSFYMPVWVRFCVDDGEFPLRSGFEEKFLDGCAGGVGEDYFVGVDVVECVAGDLVVGLVKLVDDFFNSFDYFCAEVLGGV